MSVCKQLENKTALITGCNRGIGRAVLELFASNGANLIACARNESTDFKEYISQISKKYNITIDPLYFDLRNEQEIKTILKPLLLEKRRIDILVNNAGIAFGGLLHMTSISRMKEVFEINFFSQMLIIQLVSKQMIRQNCGSIINLASIAGIDSFPGYSAYGSSKAALIYATKTLSKELAANNIRINAIAPGLTDTDMAQQMESNAKTTMVLGSAMNRLASPIEIANLTLFLASDRSSFINGQVIRVDGGM